MKSKKPLEFMYFRKDHLRNALRTFKRYACITIIEDYANSLGGEYTNKWKGKLLDYKFEFYPESAQCKLLMHVQTLTKINEIEFYIPYDCEVRYGDITKGQDYIIDYINSGPRCYYIFRRGL